MKFQELNWEISVCKEKLKETDYQAIKHSEGVISDADYQPIKSQREEWRKQINEYQALLPEAEAEYLAELESYIDDISDELEAEGVEDD